MPPDLTDAVSPEAWLRRARSNLAQARAGKIDKDVLYEDLCFDAQQAAEKAIKAILVSRGIGFPKTHSIEGLLTLVESSKLDVPSDVRGAEILTSYAVLTRYPGLSEEIFEEEYSRALELTERVVRWAEAAVSV